MFLKDSKKYLTRNGDSPLTSFYYKFSDVSSRWLSFPRRFSIDSTRRLSRSRWKLYDTTSFGGRQAPTPKQKENRLRDASDRSFVSIRCTKATLIFHPTDINSHESSSSIVYTNHPLKNKKICSTMSERATRREWLRTAAQTATFANLDFLLETFWRHRADCISSDSNSAYTWTRTENVESVENERKERETCRER